MPACTILPIKEMRCPPVRLHVSLARPRSCGHSQLQGCLGKRECPQLNQGSDGEEGESGQGPQVSWPPRCPARWLPLPMPLGSSLSCFYTCQSVSTLTETWLLCTCRLEHPGWSCFSFRQCLLSRTQTGGKTHMARTYFLSQGYPVII